MKRAKLVITSHKSDHFQGRDAKLVDADTGEELTCCQDLIVKFPLDGVATVETNIVLAEIEVIHK